MNGTIKPQTRTECNFIDLRREEERNILSSGNCGLTNAQKEQNLCSPGGLKVYMLENDMISDNDTSDIPQKQGQAVGFLNLKHNDIEKQEACGGRNETPQSDSVKHHTFQCKDPTCLTRGSHMEDRRNSSPTKIGNGDIYEDVFCTSNELIPDNEVMFLEEIRRDNEFQERTTEKSLNYSSYDVVKGLNLNSWVSPFSPLTYNSVPEQFATNKGTEMIEHSPKCFSPRMIESDSREKQSSLKTTTRIDNNGNVSTYLETEQDISSNNISDFQNVDKLSQNIESVKTSLTEDKTTETEFPISNLEIVDNRGYNTEQCYSDPKAVSDVSRVEQYSPETETLYENSVDNVSSISVTSECEIISLETSCDNEERVEQAIQTESSLEPNLQKVEQSYSVEEDDETITVDTVLSSVECGKKIQNCCLNGKKQNDRGNISKKNKYEISGHSSLKKDTKKKEHFCHKVLDIKISNKKCIKQHDGLEDYKSLNPILKQIKYLPSHNMHGCTINIHHYNESNNEIVQRSNNRKGFKREPECDERNSKMLYQKNNLCSGTEASTSENTREFYREEKDKDFDPILKINGIDGQWTKNDVQSNNFEQNNDTLKTIDESEVDKKCSGSNSSFELKTGTKKRIFKRKRDDTLIEDHPCLQMGFDGCNKSKTSMDSETDCQQTFHDDENPNHHHDKAFCRLKKNDNFSLPPVVFNSCNFIFISEDGSNLSRNRSVSPGFMQQKKTSSDSEENNEKEE